MKLHRPLRVAEESTEEPIAARPHQDTEVHAGRSHRQHPAPERGERRLEIDDLEDTLCGPLALLLGLLGKLLDGDAVAGDGRVLEVRDTHVADVELEADRHLLVQVDLGLGGREHEPELIAPSGRRLARARGPGGDGVQRHGGSLVARTTDRDADRTDGECPRARGHDREPIRHRLRHVAVHDRHLRLRSDVAHSEPVDGRDLGDGRVLGAVDLDRERGGLADPDLRRIHGGPHRHLRAGRRREEKDEGQEANGVPRHGHQSCSGSATTAPWSRLVTSSGCTSWAR